MPARLRVMHLLGDGGTGGVGSFVRDVVRSIDNDRFDVSVCVLGEAGVLSDELGQLGVRVAILDELAAGRGIALTRYAALMARTRPQILHANTGGRAHKAIARASGCNVIATHFHAFPESWMPAIRSRSESAAHMVRRAAWSSHSILCCSKWMTDEIKCYLSGHGPEVLTISNGVNLTHWLPASVDRRNAERQLRALQIPFGARIIGFVGRLVTQKGLPHVIEVARRAQILSPGVVFVIVGGGPLESVLRERVECEHLNNVRIAGEIANVRDLMSTFTVTIMPSDWEPLGIVALESMALGVPVVCFGIGGLPEVVINGRTGITVPHGDDDALTRAILSVLQDSGLREKMSNAGLERVRSEFDVRDSVTHLQDLYDSWIAN